LALTATVYHVDLSRGKIETKVLPSYQLARCDLATGYPTRSKLVDLGLDWLADGIPAAG
jgi:hypothetical protein